MCDGLDVALKVEHPPCPWEFLLCKVIEGRSAPEACRTVNPTKMLLHKNFSCLVMPRGSGTLQDLLNRYLAAKKQMDQTVAATLCLSMFRAVKQLHDNKVVHNDIKPDNILFDVVDGGQGVCVSLIDVGRGVDIELLPKNAVLFGDSGTESFRCVEMRERVPWL
jgi:serine/threonine protein kinase